MGKYAGDKEVMFMRVNGTSMDKTMPDNSLIAVKPVTLEQLKENDIVVYSDGNDYSVKYYYKDGNEVIFRPHSTERIHRDRIFNLDNDNELHIHGKVVMYIVDKD
jgi:SOS-response transcriptional repressor LexA